MATTNDNAVVDLGRLKTFKSKLDASMGGSTVNAATSPLSSDPSYEPATADTYGSVAIGNKAAATADECIALGNAAISGTEGSIALGGQSAANEANCVSVGYASSTDGPDNTAIGYTAIAGGNGGNTAIGSNATIHQAVASEAIGAHAKVLGTVQRAIALGADSVATEDKTLSVGSDSIKRRIVNVTNPINPTDAATKEYIDNIKTHILFIDNFGVTLTSQQLEAIGKHWPNVIICSGNSAAFSPIDRRIDPSNSKSLSFVFANAMYTDSGNSNIVVGANNKNYLVLQLDIDAVTGTIEPNYHVSLFPLIATNPRFSDMSMVQAIGANSIAIGNKAVAGATASMAFGYGSKASASASMAIGQSAQASHSSSMAFGIGSRTDTANQVSIGDKASGVTRYLSNVKDPVQDQDAATRYWVKNADRSDVFANNTSINTYGGSGMFDLEANRDLKWVSVSGYTSWSTFSTAWDKMVNLPGGNSNEWWIKTDLKVPDAMLPAKSFVSSHPCGLEFFSTYTMPARTFSVLVAVGSDGYIYIGKWTSKPSYGNEPYSIYLDGHRLYL